MIKKSADILKYTLVSDVKRSRHELSIKNFALSHKNFNNKSEYIYLKSHKKKIRSEIFSRNT